MSKRCHIRISVKTCTEALGTCMIMHIQGVPINGPEKGRHSTYENVQMNVTLLVPWTKTGTVNVAKFKYSLHKVGEPILN